MDATKLEHALAELIARFRRSEIDPIKKRLDLIEQRLAIEERLARLEQRAGIEPEPHLILPEHRNGSRQ